MLTPMQIVLQEKPGDEPWSSLRVKLPNNESSEKTQKDVDELD